MQHEPQRWGIVGGGMLGMTLAYRLAQAGHDVTLFEAADHVGGLADAWQLGDVVWDRHYHVMSLSDRWLRRLLEEFDLEDRIEWVETKTGVYCDGRLHSMSNALEFVRFPALGLFDKFRLAATISYAARLKTWRRLEQIPVADWLRKLSGESAFQKLWLPLLRAKLGENYKKTSAAFIWATIARMYAARRTGMKKEMFGYVPGGYATVLQAFADRLEAENVNLRTGWAASQVAPTSAGNVEIEFTDRPSEAFDQVVLTLPAPIIDRVCPDLSDDEHRRLRGIQYQGIICASLLLKKPLAKFYVTNITDDWVPFTGVIEMSSLVDRRQFDGNALVYLPKYVPPDDPLFACSDDEIRERFLSALERMYPDFDRDDVLAFRLSRVRNVVALSTLNYSQNLPPMQSSVPGVWIVNSAHIVNGTLNVNETVRLAEETVQQVLLPGAAGRERVFADATDPVPILEGAGV